MQQIVVGGGTAGLAVASRLSQYLPDDRILIIEAGPDGRNEPRIFIPGYKGSTLGTVYDWNFTTVPQRNALNRTFAQARGRVLGGSSALNLMAWDRGAEFDYDDWEYLGNPGWNWKSMLDAMLKAENFVRDPWPPYGGEGIGFGGPIQALINRFIPAQQWAFIPALASLGLPENINSLGGDPLGAMYHSSNIRRSNYARSYATDYLDIADSGICLMLNTTVARVNFAPNAGGEKLTATSVQLVDGTNITAEKEIILSAGSLQSPALLELSGIGDPAILADGGIECLANLPGVGENLQDHIRIQNSYQLKDEYASVDRLRYDAQFAAQQLSLWYEGKNSTYDYTGSGYAYMTWDQVSGASVSQLLEAARDAAASDNSPQSSLKLHNLMDAERRSRIPQLEIIFSDGYTGVKGYPANATSLYGKGFFTLITAIQHPFSRGSVHVNTTTPPSILNQPVINPNYLSHRYDLLAAVTASKYVRLLANAAPLRDVWVSEYEPGPGVQTDADFELYAKNTTLTIYHPVGTCSMMPKNKGGVVDPELRVFGTSNLRIVDASIMPTILSAHVQTAVYGIAERAAQIVARSHAHHVSL